MFRLAASSAERRAGGGAQHGRARRARRSSGKSAGSRGCPAPRRRGTRRSTGPGRRPPPRPGRHRRWPAAAGPGPGRCLGTRRRTRTCTAPAARRARSATRPTGRPGGPDSRVVKDAPGVEQVAVLVGEGGQCAPPQRFPGTGSVSAARRARSMSRSPPGRARHAPPRQPAGADRGGELAGPGQAVSGSGRCRAGRAAPSPIR